MPPFDRARATSVHCNESRLGAVQGWLGHGRLRVVGH